MDNMQAPIQQQIIDLATGLPTKLMADFMHQLATSSGKMDPETAEQLKELFDKNSDSDASIRDLTAELLALARQLGASVSDTEEAIQTATESLARKISLITASLSEAAAAIAEERQARVLADEAMAKIRTVMAAEFDSARSAITQEQRVRTTADEALAQSITTLEATVDDNTAAISTEQTARADADSALASSISTVSTTVSGHTTSITEITQSIDGIEGKWGVSIDAGGNVTGIELIGGSESGLFKIDADVLVNGTLTADKIVYRGIGDTEFYNAGSLGAANMVYQKIIDYTPSAYPEGTFFITINFTADARHDVDTYVYARLWVGGSLKTVQWSGVRATDGDTHGIFPITLTATGSSNQRIEVDVSGCDYRLTPGQGDSKPIAVWDRRMSMTALKV